MQRIATALVSACLIASAANAAQEPEFIPFFNASDEANADAIDHVAWQALLTTYVVEHPSGINRFDYARLKADTDDVTKLNAYLETLQAIDPRTYALAEQQPYWINLYNALTIKVVTDAYPVDSIRDIHEGWLPYTGPWDDVHTAIAEQELTLNDIEHGILRPIWQDARIHYAVNCASLGCPNLTTEAYTAANTEALLEAGAREYVNHPRGVDFVDGDFVVLSSIYDWWVADFGGTEESVLAHLVEYADPELAAELRDFVGGIDFEYDWDLNEP